MQGWETSGTLTPGIEKSTPCASRININGIGLRVGLQFNKNKLSYVFNKEPSGMGQSRGYIINE